MRIRTFKAAISSGALAAFSPLVMAAQTTPAISTAPFEQRTGVQIEKQAHEFLEQAKSRPDGIVSVTLEKYPGHLTMLTARTKPGGAEQHRDWNDIFIVLEGEATERIGGTIVDAKETTSGEVRGKEVVGGVEHVMRKGDVIHIAPGTPHQTVVADGKYFLYYVIKVQAPAAK